MKDNKGLTRMTLILLVVAIILVIVGIALVYLSNSEEKSEESINTVNSTTVSTKNTEDEEKVEIPEDAVTDDFEITGYYADDNNSKYECDVYIEYTEEDYTTTEIDYTLEVDISEFDLPTCLFDYNDCVRLRITYDENDYTVYDCQVINYLTDEIIEDTSEENIKKLFDIEYDKDIIEADWTDTINLSDIDKNNIYKYTATEASQFPEIVNDTDSNCIVYIKEYYSDLYEKDIIMYNNIDASAELILFDEFEEGDTFSITYVVCDNETILKYIDEDDVIYLSGYSSGDKLSYTFEDYIYNDTEHDIEVTTENNGNSEIYNIKAGEVWGFNWMVDSVTIKY